MKRLGSPVSESFQQRPRPSAMELPIGSSPLGSDDGCLEATIVVEPGERSHVRLTQLAWGVGVGWYAQHSLDLTVDEAHELARLLGRVPQGPETAATPTVPVVLAEYRDRKASRSRSQPVRACFDVPLGADPVDDCVR
jgi:hypothetical protein